jgi:hypothetical protein
MTKRTCGTCSLCCKLPYVRELNQSIDTCASTQARALRLLDLSRSAVELSRFHLRLAVWRRNRRRVVPRALQDVYYAASIRRSPQKGNPCNCDPAYPNAWRPNPYDAQLLAWAQHMLVEIRVDAGSLG